MFGGSTTSPIIESPKLKQILMDSLRKRIVWHIATKNPENYIRIELLEYLAMLPNILKVCKTQGPKGLNLNFYSDI